MARPIVLLAILLLIAPVGCATRGRSVRGVPNFATIEDGLYRGGQPTREGIEYLKERGVRSIINLRDDFNPREEVWAHDAGMHYVLIRTNAARVRTVQVARFLKEVEDAPRPIFVHCYHGRDRTGLEVAVYRIVKCGWTRDAALSELYAYGYQWAAFPGLARYVASFNEDEFATAPFAGSPTASGSAVRLAIP
jgi:protein tyrosine/serine phosphatase